MKEQQTANNTNNTPAINLDDLATSLCRDSGIISIDTSIEQIGAMLYYLAECEFLFSQTHENYEAAIYNGRGFLLKMLGEGLNHFCQNFESITKQFNELKQQNHDASVALGDQQSQSVLLTQIKSSYEQLLSLDGKDADKAYQLQQTIDALNEQLA